MTLILLPLPVNSKSNNLEAEAKYNEILAQVHAYYKLIQPDLEEKFNTETRELQYYNPYSNIVENLDCEIDDQSKTLYHLLAKICHPDKCSEPWAKPIFEFLNDCYHENNHSGLEQLHNYWLQYGTFDKFLDSIGVLDSINSIQSSPWFQWNVCASTRERYISTSEYNQRTKLAEDERKYREIFNKLFDATRTDTSHDWRQRSELVAIMHEILKYHDSHNYEKLDEINTYFLQHKTLLGYNSQV